MTLDPFERESALWKRLNKHFEERLELCRRKNDSRNLSELDTAFLRGEINQLKVFLALGNPSPDLTNSE